MSVPHHLPPEEALKRIKTLLGEVKAQYADKITSLREDWNGNTGRFNLTAMGFSVAGMLAVKPSEVQLTADLPFAAILFKGKLESTIRERAETLLA